MKAAFKKGSKKIVCIETKKPEIKNDKDVIVKVLHAGICGSDINRVRNLSEKWNNVILGHEGVGLVAEIGSKVESYSIGDKVAIIPLIPCFNCNFCKEGCYSLCNEYSFIGSRINGVFSEYVSVNEKNLIKLPENDDIKKFVFLEPLTVALRSIYKANLKFGQTAAVLGAGTIGLLIFQLLTRLGVCDVIISDIDNYKLEIAKKLDADYFINVLEEPISEYIKRSIGISGVDITFESSGNSNAKNDSILVTGKKGKIILIGTSPSDVLFKGEKFELITRKELMLIGMWMSYSSPFPGLEWSTAIKVLKKNMINIELIRTHSFKLEEIEKAFNMIFEGNESYCKIIINM